MRDRLERGVGFAALVVIVGMAGCADSGDAVGPSAASAAPGTARAASRAVTMPVVGLDELVEGWPEAGAGGRNPFSFGPAGRSGLENGSAAEERVEPEADPTGGPLGTAGPGPAGAPAGAGVTLKFIGTVDGGQVGRVAVLSDGSFVYHGRAGDIVDGRYRILRIGIESLELEVLDGGRRQTVRLTGS